MNLATFCPRKLCYMYNTAEGKKDHVKLMIAVILFVCLEVFICAGLYIDKFLLILVFCNQSFKIHFD